MWIPMQARTRNELKLTISTCSNRDIFQRNREISQLNIIRQRLGSFTGLHQKVVYSLERVEPMELANRREAQVEDMQRRTGVN